MTDKQFAMIIANMHAQSAYQQQTIGHLVGLVNGLARQIARIGKAQELSEDDLLKDFSTGARVMTQTLAEIPFPDFQLPDETPDSPNSSKSQ